MLIQQDHPKIIPPKNSSTRATSLCSPWPLFKLLTSGMSLVLISVAPARGKGWVPSWKYPSFYRILLRISAQPTQPCLLRLALSRQLHKNPGQPVPPGTFDICRRGAWTGGIEMNEDVPITTATSTLWQWEVIWDNHR